MTIYLDIIFLENIIMNYIILYVVAYILKRTKYKIKILISSILGAIYSVILYLNIFEIYTNLIMKIILSTVMVYIAYTPANLKTLFKQLIFFYFISFLFGGCAFAVIYTVLPKHILNLKKCLIGIYPIKITLAAGILGVGTSFFSFKIIKKKVKKKDILCPIKINLENKTAETIALIDTGNLLKEPITGRPVIIVEKGVLENIIPINILDNLLKIIGGDYKEINNIEYKKYISRFKIIPFSSIGKENGMLIGILVDSIKIKFENTYEEIEEVVVGIYEKEFTRTKKYKALLGLEILERSMEDEYF